jgi:exonuclease III
LSIISANAKGLRNNVKRKALFLFGKQLKTDLYFFQESHSFSTDVNFWRSQWGNDVWLSHGSECSAGVTTLENHLNGSILHSDCDPFGHFLCLVINCKNNIIIIITNIYGYNSKRENDQLLESLEKRILHWLTKFSTYSSWGF